MKGSTVVLILAFLALIAVLLFEYEKAPPATVGEAADDSGLGDIAMGPTFLVYNSPWAFAPPVGNVLPQTSVGQVGQTGGCQCGTKQTLH